MNGPTAKKGLTMEIDIASNSLEILGRQGRILRVDFAAPLDELSIRKHRKALRAVHRNTTRQDRDLRLILLELDQVLSPFFAADDHTHPIRVLNGLTLTAIVARKAPSELGNFGLDVYGRALRDLQNAGEFRQPIAGYHGLEALFADKVAGVIEVMAQDRRRRGLLEQVDEVFYALSTGRKLESRTDEVSRLDELVSKIEHIASVFSTPEFLTDLLPPQEVPSTLAQKANRAKRSRGTAGSYVDFYDRVRTVPDLTAFTIQGIASAPGILEADDASTIDYQQVAVDASAYRRSLRLGGPNIAAASAEFHVRIFRAIGLTCADVAALSAEDLKALVQKATDLHALACEPEAKAKAA
jgi:hypothetical protein